MHLWQVAHHVHLRHEHKRRMLRLWSGPWKAGIQMKDQEFADAWGQALMDEMDDDFDNIED